LFFGGLSETNAHLAIARQLSVTGCAKTGYISPLMLFFRFYRKISCFFTAKLKKNKSLLISMENQLSDDKKHILNILRKNSRAKKSDIAELVCMPVSTVSAAMKSMEKDLRIRYSPLLDYRKIGHSTRAIFIIKMKDSGLLDFLSDHENINTICRTKENDILFLEAIFKGMKDMADFTEEIGQAGGKIVKEFHIIEDLKREEFEI
jgi:DNA-binding Lrp family transcriptional regulator